MNLFWLNRNVRCVFDTNTLISALLFKNSVPGRAFYLVLDQGKILVSTETLEELVEVINRPKFDKYLTDEEREEFLGSLLASAELIEILEEAQICRDPKDDKFLNLAANGAADYLITGDEDLLVLQSYRNTQIINAKNFLDVQI